MYCAKCGKEIPDSATVCPDCGTTVPKVNEPGKTIGLISMILGFVALGTQLTGVGSTLSLPAGIAAVICGFIAKSQAAKAGNRNTDATAGIICGFSQIAAALLTSIISLIFTFGIIIFYVIFFYGLAITGAAV